MLNRLILSFVSFIAGLSLMALLYDFRLWQNEITIGTHALTSGGLSIEQSAVIKTVWGIVMLVLTIVMIIKAPKEETNGG